MWCGVVWCDDVWCGVVWCVLTLLLFCFRSSSFPPHPQPCYPCFCVRTFLHEYWVTNLVRVLEQGWRMWSKVRPFLSVPSSERDGFRSRIPLIWGLNLADLHARTFVVLVVRGCTHNWEIEMKNMLERQKDQMQVNENTKTVCKNFVYGCLLSFVSFCNRLFHSVIVTDRARSRHVPVQGGRLLVPRCAPPGLRSRQAQHCVRAGRHHARARGEDGRG